MTSPRQQMAVVCPEGHTLARVTASPEGPMLTIEHLAVGTLPRPGEDVRMADTGPRSEPMRLQPGGDSTEAVCVGCGKEFFINPREIHGALTEGRRRFVVHPIAF